MVDAGEGCIGWGARDRDLMRGTVEERVGFNAVYVPAGETKISSVME